MSETLTPAQVERVEAAQKKMLMVYTPEQFEQLAELSMLIHDRAILRQCNQTLTVDMNDKGWIRYFHASDNVPAIKPVTYKPE
jgi:hypothetical protein